MYVGRRNGTDGILENLDFTINEFRETKIQPSPA